MSGTPPNTPPKRMWQFDLWTMLVVTTLIAVLLAPVAYFGWIGLLPDHRGGAIGAFADGHVEFLHDSTLPERLRALFTIAGHEKTEPRD